MSKMRAHVMIGILAPIEHQEARLEPFKNWELRHVFPTRNSLNEAQIVYVFEREISS